MILHPEISTKTSNSNFVEKFWKFRENKIYDLAENSGAEFKNSKSINEEDLLLSECMNQTSYWLNLLRKYSNQNEETFSELAFALQKSEHNIVKKFFDSSFEAANPDASMCLQTLWLQCVEITVRSKVISSKDNSATDIGTKEWAYSICSNILFTTNHLWTKSLCLGILLEIKQSQSQVSWFENLFQWACSTKDFFAAAEVFERMQNAREATIHYFLRNSAYLSAEMSFWSSLKFCEMLLKETLENPTNSEISLSAYQVLVFSKLNILKMQQSESLVANGTVKESLKNDAFNFQLLAFAKIFNSKMHTNYKLTELCIVLLEHFSHSDALTEGLLFEISLGNISAIETGVSNNFEQAKELLILLRSFLNNYSLKIAHNPKKNAQLQNVLTLAINEVHNQLIQCESELQLQASLETSDYIFDLLNQICVSVRKNEVFVLPKIKLSISLDVFLKKLQFETRNSFPIEVFETQETWKFYSGNYFTFKMWRFLHELRNPSSDKRQGFSHTQARKFCSSLQLVPNTLAELAQTKVPGEPLLNSQTGSWHPELPLLDMVLDSIWLKEHMKIFHSTGITKLQAPKTFWNKLKSYTIISWNFEKFSQQRLLSIQNQENTYFTTLTKLGFVIFSEK